MKASEFFPLLAISLIIIQACADEPTIAPAKPIAYYDSNAYNNTKGYWENGEIITSFDCPDSKFFPPIDIRSWDKIPVVNGRFPTCEETYNGTSIHHYGVKKNPGVKPYPMMLPKLAYRLKHDKQNEFERNTSNGQQISKAGIVVVIQIVQTAKDTIVGYRYLTGGCGGSAFHDFHFLTDSEVKNVVGL